MWRTKNSEILLIDKCVYSAPIDAIDVLMKGYLEITSLRTGIINRREIVFFLKNLVVS